MLTIQPGLANNLNRFPAFGRGELQRYAEDAEYVDYEDVTDSYTGPVNRDFDYDEEKREAKHELDLWEQTKANVDSIAQATNNVPIVKKGTKVLSGLTMVAIGWGGLRWGSVGTLEVLSKIMETSAAKSVKGFAERSGRFVSEKFGSLNRAIAGTDTYKAISRKTGEWSDAFMTSAVGTKLTNLKTAIGKNPIYKDAVKLKDKAVDGMKNLNYKRVFVESMGVAGGGTAAINVIGGKAIDGTKQNVEVDENGNYSVDGVSYDAA